MNLNVPFRFDGRGRTAESDSDAHIRQMIAQLLFTAPGERVNRPTFGSGLRQLVFAPNSGALAAATKLAVQAGLQEWLGDVVEVGEVDVEADEAALRVRVSYVVRRTGEARTVELEG
jgi:phage baseplate assembly protein W